MSKIDPTERKLQALDHAADSLPKESLLAELRKALLKENSVVAARAATLAADRELTELTEDLAAAFQRFLKDPVRTDKGCLAKSAIVRALRDLRWRQPEVYLAGIRHIQMEPGFGPPQDAADSLRAACAYALHEINYRRIHYVLAELLMDPEPEPRLAAARVLAGLHGLESELMLRMKALMGDARPDVMGECFSALMSMAPEESLGFVGQYLDREPALAEEAALALGESRRDEAFELLTAAYENQLLEERRQALLVPISLLRSAESFEFLLNLVKEGSRTISRVAAKALEIHSHDPQKMERLKKALDQQ